MATASSHGRNMLYALLQGFSTVETLHPVPSGKMNQIIISIGKVQGEGIQTLHKKSLLGNIFDSGISGNHVLIRIENVIQLHLYPLSFFFQENAKSFTFLYRLGMGKALRKRSSGKNLHPVNAQIQNPLPVRTGNATSRNTIISISKGRILLGQGIHGVGSVCICIIGITGKSSILILEKVGKIPFSPFAVIIMQKMPIGTDSHLIGSISTM